MVELISTLLLLVVSSPGPQDSESHHLAAASPPQMLTLIECVGSSGSVPVQWVIGAGSGGRNRGTRCLEALRAPAMLNPCDHVCLYLSKFLPIGLCDGAN